MSIVHFIWFHTRLSSAGKGRSGTMACAYLLTLEESLSQSSHQPTAAVRAHAEELAKQVMDVMPTDDDPGDGSKTVDSRTSDAQDNNATMLDKPTVDSPRTLPLEADLGSHPTMSEKAAIGGSGSPAHAHPDALHSVLDLHTSRRMKQGDSKKKIKPGVSIPSQRRWLLYWSILLIGAGPRGFWGLNPSLPYSQNLSTHPKARLLSVTVRMREPKGVTASLVKAVNTLADQTSWRNRNAPKPKRRGEGEVWISLARYDDGFVDTLEGMLYCSSDFLHTKTVRQFRLGASYS
jgi:phosphatidylinositol-3,4,5-trisphosphate 3-phosphatase/dual-specificity protein phosphatase PTEN